MPKLIAIAAALAFVSAPVLAQNSSGTGTMTPPSANNSGAGIAGQPGNKNGPAPKSTSGSASEENAHAQQQDSSKIPGKAGGKSGPAVHAPSNGMTK
jgi:hypothetical protein